MFQYAAGRALSTQSDMPLGLDVAYYSSQSVSDTPRSFELDLLKIRAQVIKNPQFTCVSPNHFLNRAVRQIYFARFKNFFEKRAFSYDPLFFEAAKCPVILTGYWQSYRYLQPIAQALTEEFKPKSAPSLANQNLFDELAREDYVSIHVRRSDYITNSHAAKFHGVCSLDYYRHAAKIIATKQKIQKALVFSDDPEWCQTNLRLPWDTQFIQHNQGKDALWDLQLMSKCKAHIIANSSFSWWGAWLAQEGTRTVVAPNQWTVAAHSDYADLLPPDWIRI